MKCSRLLTLIIVPTIYGTGTVVFADEPAPRAVRDAVAQSSLNVGNGGWTGQQGSAILSHKRRWHF
ncbi:MAG: hypothetical protein ABGZ23_08845 [Fuerstiella sp.]|nr:hypothetical protein [Fuerstiella sp.]